MELVLEHVPKRAVEGMFWGNGRMGVMLYCEGAALRLAVDHADFWETRDPTGGVLKADLATLRQQAEGYVDGNENLVQPTMPWERGPFRTRLPAMVVKVPLPMAVRRFRGRLDLREAVGRFEAWLPNGETVEGEGYVHAGRDVFELTMGRGSGQGMRAQVVGWDLGAVEVLRRWGYVEAEVAREGEMTHALQGFAGERVAVLSVLTTVADGRQVGLVTVDVGAAGEAVEVRARNGRRLREFLADRAGAGAEHIGAWEAYWKRCRLEVPEEALQLAVEAERYKLFANARGDGAAVTLQGVWNDDQRMPGWCGDLHNDLNVQACYWPAMKTNGVELARPYVRAALGALGHFRARARVFAGVTDGAMAPTMMDPSGRGVGTEWNFWNTLLGPELFLATDLIAYQRHGGDAGLLPETLDFLRHVARLYEALAVRGEDGRWHLEFTHSPEVFQDGRLLMGRDAAFHLAALHHVLRFLTEAGDVEAGRWARFDAELAAVPTGGRGLQLLRGQEVFASHRHFTHLYPLFPLGTLDRTRPADAAVIEASLDWLLAFGFAGFAAWSFPYLAILAARAGRGNMARMMLEIYLRGFRTRNTFAVNGDVHQTGVLTPAENLAGETLDACTLEAGLMVPAAVAEMLAHRAGDTIWLLAGVPEEWARAEATNLTLPGPYAVTVAMREHLLAEAAIVCGADGVLHVACDQTAGEYRVEVGAGVQSVQGDRGIRLRLAVGRGQTVTIRAICA